MVEASALSEIDFFGECFLPGIAIEVIALACVTATQWHASFLQTICTRQKLRV
jgi:hypothetical protein